MPPGPYQSLVNLLSNILEAYTTAFFLINPKSRRLDMVAAQSLSKFLPETISLPLEQSGLLSQVHKMGQTVRLDNVQESSSDLTLTLPFYREGESHIKGLLAAPVGDGAGVLYVDTKYGWGFNSKQQKWIREIALLLNEILQRQECLKQQRDYARILDSCRRLDDAAFRGCALEDYCQLLVDESSQLTGNDYAFLALREAASPDYRLLAGTRNIPRNLLSQNFFVKQGLVGRIIQNQKALHIPQLNSEASDHFLFTPGEALPHHGTLWGLPARISLGHCIVLALLSRQSVEWSSEDQYAVSHMMHFFHLLMEQFYFKEECEQLQSCDFTSGLPNSPAFEARVEETVATSLGNSLPFSLALLQLEPWQILYTKASPGQVRQWQEQLALGLCEDLPSNVVLGQITENRFGLLFPEMTPQEVNHRLSSLKDPGHGSFAEKANKIRVQPYLGAAHFPRDGTSSNELWPSVYRHLFAAFRSKAEKSQQFKRAE